MDFNFPAALAVLFFILPISFKRWHKQVIQLSDLAKCTLSAMALPNLVICLFYIITNPNKAMAMPESLQYLTIAVLVIAYITIQEIIQIFNQKKVE